MKNEIRLWILSMMWLDFKAHAVRGVGKYRGLSTGDFDALTTMAGFNYACPGDGVFHESLLHSFLLGGKIVHCSQYGPLSYPGVIGKAVPDDVETVVPIVYSFTEKRTMVYMAFKTSDPAYKTPEAAVEALEGTQYNGVAMVVLPITPETLSEEARPKDGEVVRNAMAVHARTKHGSIFSMMKRAFKLVDIEIVTDAEDYHTTHREGSVPWTPKVYYEVAKKLRQMSENKLQGLSDCFVAFPETLPDPGLTYQKQVTVVGVKYSLAYTGCVTLVTSTGLEIPFVVLPKKYIPTRPSSSSNWRDPEPNYRVLDEPIIISFENPEWKSSFKSRLRERVHSTAVEFTV